MSAADLPTVAVIVPVMNEEQTIAELTSQLLSVGDASFVAKAEERMQAFVGRASIMVLASHNPQIINDLCNVKLTLEHGTIKAFERPADVPASIA